MSPRPGALRLLALGAIGLGLVACATKRPVLYPNAQLQQVGEVRAREEVDDCIALAKHHVGDTDPAVRAGAQTGAVDQA